MSSYHIANIHECDGDVAGVSLPTGVFSCVKSNKSVLDCDGVFGGVLQLD